ncbi:unnamed protein product [Linum tenue]|uniref:non-specific serine/threonine protein kinase n=1 Tax=Linum tenue TaxID=586396 RepID=A0AAV0GSB5_9ROSI|nr:unnamed protein product [Linum tenue]
MDKYELVKDIGSGNFGIARLMRNKQTRELVAMKYIERGPKIDENVAREIINHRSLRHPNIIRFKELVLTPTHLSIVMEYAAGGELFERICNAGRFSEDEARYFFQQLISGVSYCHSMVVLSRREYDGKLADVWSCGVTLYVMLVGAYPFEDQDDPKNFRKTINRIMAVQYKIPDYVHISQDCRHLISRIFVANPLKRVTIKEIKSHPWFLKNLPRELTEAAQTMYYRKENPAFSLQTVEEIMKIVEEAKVPAKVSRSIGTFGWGAEDEEDEEDTKEEEPEPETEEEAGRGGGGDEYEKRVKEAQASGEFRVS